MKTISDIINFQANDIEEICKYLLNSNIMIMPSDTLYGIAALAYDKLAVSKVFEIKERGFDRKLPIHYSSIEQMEKDIEITPIIDHLINKFMPGGLTIIAKKKANSKLQFVEQTVAVRIPNHPILLSVIKTLNQPLTMPSANKHKINPENQLAKIQTTIPIRGLQDDENINHTPSTIFDSINNQIIRNGIINSDVVLNSLKESNLI